MVSSIALYFLAGDFVATTRRAVQVGAFHWWAKFGPILVASNLAALVVGSVVAGYVVLYASHKVVGPLVRVHAALREIGEGRLHYEVKLREGDALQDTAKAILDMEDKLFDQICRVDAAVASLEQELSTESIEHLKKVVAALPRKKAGPILTEAPPPGPR